MATLTVMSMNLQYGGRDGRWSHLAGLVREVRPHVLLLQEAVGWAGWAGRRRFAAARRDVALTGRLGAASGYGFHTGILVDPAALELVRWETKYAAATVHGHTELVARVPGLTEPVVFISAHLTPYSAYAAADEARLLVARAHRQRGNRLDGLGLVGGDLNHVPLGDDEPPWGEVAAPDRAARALLVDGELRANRAVGQALAAGGLVDAAGHLADERHDPALRAPTAWAGRVRTDQIHLTARLAPALIDYQRIDATPWSDHDAVVTVLDLDRLTSAR